MDKTTEWAHKNGMCPDIFYYQLNGKSATENYIDQKKKFMEIAKNGASFFFKYAR